MRHNLRTFFSLALFMVACSLAGIAAQASVEPRRFAILVGINQYSDPGLVSLQKAQNDAEDLGKALSRLGGYKSVTVMSGGLPYNDVNFPSKNKIVERVGALADIVRPDDQVLFFFSGHGVNDKSGESYLLPIDAQIKDPTGTGIDLQNDIIAPLQSAGVKNIVCLVDACQKTVAKDKGLAIVGINEIKSGSRAVVITATGKGKASYEDPNGANGLFTRGILAALSGEADLNHDGLLSVADLERYLPDAVSEYAFSVGINQKPAVFDSGNGSLQPALVRFAAVSQAAPPAAAGAGAGATAVSAAPTAAPSAKAQFVQFKVPEGVRVDLRLLTPDGREVKAWSDTSSFSDKLEPGNYRVEVQDRSYLYYPYSTTIAVGATKVAVVLDLKPNFGSLFLSCDPSDGVQVLLNGEKRGSLSGGALTVDRLKSGSYELVASKELYDTKRQSIQIEDGKVAQVKLVLSPNFFTLSVSEKAGMAASLYVDGQNKGSLPQTIKLPFRSVSLRVVPSDSRYKEWSDSVAPAVKGSVEKRVAVLAGRTGTVEVTTDPDADAELTLTPSAGGPAQKIGTAPLDYDTLVGDYELRAEASLNGKKMAADAKVTVREAQTSPMRLELKEAIPDRPKVAIGTLFFVQGGNFIMGNNTSGYNSARPAHQVKLSSFFMSKTEVTVGEFRRFVEATGYKTQAERNDGGVVVIGGKTVSKSDSNWRNPYFQQTDDHPVVLVCWLDAIEYCNWLSKKEGLQAAYIDNGRGLEFRWDSSANGYRLPTEAEWEYAARGGNLSKGFNYSGGQEIDSVSWNSANSGRTTHPVACKEANELGIYDMSGNVAEWCWDLYGEYPANAQIDPRGAEVGKDRVFRGGDFQLEFEYCKPMSRLWASYANRWSELGFRIVKSGR